MSVFLYIIFTLALFITFTIKGEGGDGTLSFPPVCSPLIWLWNVMVLFIPLRAKFLCWCSNRHRSAEINTAVLISAPPPAPTLEEVPAAELITCALLKWRKMLNHTKPNDSAVTATRTKTIFNPWKFWDLKRKFNPAPCLFILWGLPTIYNANSAVDW